MVCGVLPLHSLVPIRDGIQEAKKELGALRYYIEDTVCYLDSFEYLMRGLMVQKMKEVRSPKGKGVVDEGSQTLPQPAARSTLDTRKRFIEPTMSPEASEAKKAAEKRPKVSNEQEELRSPRRRTSGKGKKRSLLKSRRNLAVRAQKRCSSNPRRG